MKNIIVALIIGISIIASSLIIISSNERYKIVMNQGSDMSGFLTIKYDTTTGQSWGLDLPQKNWVEIKDYGYVYTAPEKKK